MAKRQRGFTLLEVMIALAVFATLGAAVLSATQYVLKQRAGLQARVVATWVGDNHLTELRLLPALGVGEKQQRVQMDQRVWQVRQRVSPASDVRLLQVDLYVAEQGHDYPLYQTRAWIAKPHE
ncbi:type II secretion system minor pseudopilin GspI [Pseudomonas sp. SDO528_S397]